MMTGGANPEMKARIPQKWKGADAVPWAVPEILQAGGAQSNNAQARLTIIYIVGREFDYFISHYMKTPYIVYPLFQILTTPCPTHTHPPKPTHTLIPHPAGADPAFLIRGDLIQKFSCQILWNYSKEASL